MKIVFHLSTCDTCRRILKELSPGSDVRLQDIKSERITESQLERLALLSGGYEPLFSRKAVKYRTLGLGEKQLSEVDYRRLILDDYTFLKRPIVVISDKIFIGNAANTVTEAKNALHG
jgi:arsenate reductase-like glutaredoxin family protein